MMPAAVQPPTDAVPVPEDYNVVRDMLEQNPEIVDLGISAVMDMAGTGCERSTAQGVIDHLQDAVSWCSTCRSRSRAGTNVSSSF